MEQNRKVYLEKSLNDLKQKLKTLDILMHTNAKWGDLKKTDQTAINNYCNSNPFAKRNKTITN